MSPCLLIATIFVIAWVGAAIAYAVFGGTGPYEEAVTNRIRFKDAVGGKYLPSWRILEWSRTSK